MSSNLPPGVTPGMIPGNRGEDAEWEHFLVFVDESLAQGELSLEEAYMAVNIGKAAVLAIRPDIKTMLHSARADVFYP